MASEPHTVGAGASRAAPEVCASHDASTVNTLRQAMRRASIESAERAGVVSDLRSARFARLEMLQDALKPLNAQIPHDVDLFEMSVLPGLTPRLFIDIIGFVEMGRDARAYRFFQDTRHGRELIAESADIDRLIDAVTDYVARRLLERERALAASVEEHRSPAATVDNDALVRRAEHVGSTPKPRSALDLISAAFWFLIHVLGSVTFFLLLAFAGWLIWNGMHKPT